MIATATALFIKPLDLDMLDHIDFKIWYSLYATILNISYCCYVWSVIYSRMCLKISEGELDCDHVDSLFSKSTHSFTLLCSTSRSVHDFSSQTNFKVIVLIPYLVKHTFPYIFGRTSRCTWFVSYLK